MTKLFSTVKQPTNFLYKFFFPSLPPVVVAKAVIAALDDQHSRVVYLPFYAHFVPLLFISPSFVRDLAQWITGCDFALDEFVKITGRRPEEGLVSLTETSKKA